MNGFRSYDIFHLHKISDRLLSLADSVGIATAAELDGTFVTSDHHELEAIAEKEASLKFFWFR